MSDCCECKDPRSACCVENMRRTEPLSNEEAAKMIGAQILDTLKWAEEAKDGNQ